MKKSILLILFMFFGIVLHAQSKPETKEAEKNQQEVRKEETLPNLNKDKDEVKAVPTAKSGAKPERVENRRSNSARPTTVRPAKNPRPTVIRGKKPGVGGR